MKINSEISSIRDNESIMKIKNLRILRMNSQKSIIIIIKLIILKRTVKKKTSSKNHKDSSVNQIQIQILNQILN